VWSLSAFGQRNHVATDSKIISYKTFDAARLEVMAIR
jgi:hypothetical protein